MHTSHVSAPTRIPTPGSWPVRFWLPLLLILAVFPLQSHTRHTLPAVPTLPEPLAETDSTTQHFVLNAGQMPDTVLAATQSAREQVAFLPDGVMLSLPGTADDLRVQFLDTRPVDTLRGIQQQPGRVHYLYGSDPASWSTNLPTYAGLAYDRIYPGIDLYYEGTDAGLKSTFVVAPGADSARIRWHYAGVERVQHDGASGDLLLHMRDGSVLTEHAPVAWQQINGQRVMVAVRYRLLADGSIGFAPAAYDPAYALTIDPTLAYSTYLGGDAKDQSNSITVDNEGNIYIAGFTLSRNFPTENGAFPDPAGSPGDQDAFVSKLDPTGQTLLYSTYLSSSALDEAKNIAVDDTGQVYITGFTLGSDFPLSDTTYQDALRGSADAFLVQLRADGTLRYGTYLGGSEYDVGEDLIVAANGTISLVGSTTSEDFPTANPIQAVNQSAAVGSTGEDLYDAFLLQISPDGAAPSFSTYLGGSLGDQGFSLDQDSAGNLLLTGFTRSADFLEDAAVPGTLSGVRDAFVVKVNPTSSEVLYRIFFGGDNVEGGEGIVVDESGRTTVVGYATSDAIAHTSAIQPDYGGGSSDAFVLRLDAAGAIVFSTYFGGSGSDWGYEIARDADNYTYVTGNSASADLELINPIADSRGTGQDVFVAAFTPDGSVLALSTLIGGSGAETGTSIAVNRMGDVYVTGLTDSTDFPTINPHQSAKAGDATTADAFVIRIADVLQQTRLSSVTPASAVANAGEVPLIINGANLQVPLSAQIGGVELLETTLETTTTLHAVVPVEQLAEGAHDLNITMQGRTITLPDAFTVEPAAVEAAYRVMVYLACDNDLHQSCDVLLNELEAAVAANSNLHVVVLYDGSEINDSAYYEVQGDDNPILRANYTDGVNRFPLGEVDTAAPATLVRFAAWAQSRYPGQYKLLSLVGHGGGWAPALHPAQPRGSRRKSSPADVGGMLWDDHPTSATDIPATTMATRSMAEALQYVTDAYQLDVLYLDACLMSTVEVLFELSPYAAYIVAHENQTWATHPYAAYLEGVTADTDPLVFARQIATAYRASLDQAGSPAQVSVLDVAGVGLLNLHLDDFTEALSDTLPASRAVLTEVVSNTARVDENSDWRINTADNAIDLLDFVRRVKAHPDIPDSVDAPADDLISAISMTVAMSAVHPADGIDTPWEGVEAWDLSELNGLSFYFPLQDSWKRAFYNADGLPTFARWTEWDEFITAWHADSTPPPQPSAACPYPCPVTPMHTSLHVGASELTTDTEGVVYVPVDIGGARLADGVSDVQFTMTADTAGILGSAPADAAPRLADAAAAYVISETERLADGWRVWLTLSQTTTMRLASDSLPTLAQDATTPISGTGTLVEVPFTAQQAGCIDMRISDSRLNDLDDQLINHYLPPGEVCVRMEPPAPDHAVFLPLLRR